MPSLAPGGGGVVAIDQWRPAYDLQALCRIGGAPYTVHNSAYPLYVATGDLPQVRCGSVALGGQKGFDWLRKASCLARCGREGACDHRCRPSHARSLARTRPAAAAPAHG